MTKHYTKYLFTLPFLAHPLFHFDFLTEELFQQIIPKQHEEVIEEKLPEPVILHEITPEKTLPQDSGYTINFNEVSIAEFIRFVSKIAEINFIFDESLLNFNISLISGKPSSPEDIFRSLSEILDKKGFVVVDREHYFLIEPKPPKKKKKKKAPPPAKEVPIIQNASLEVLPTIQETKPKGKFATYKLKYHEGTEILAAIKQIASSSEISPELLKTIDSMQLVKSTNSIFYSGTDESVIEAKEMIEALDTPLKQVFIEVLVIETDVKSGMEFGLEWAAGGKYRDSVGFGTGNFPATGSKLAKPFSKVNGANPPSGPDQFPLGRGFDLGVIGDIILHKGSSFFSLGSLVSALQQDGNTTIVLNQKLITQDNKSSQIFVGDNIPFTGSVVQTVGSSQQTTSNIEYRDVGVSLLIKPLLGEGDVITLEITEEISEATSDPINTNQVVNGIQTTKSNVLTSAHVPDNNFLVLSGMIRNANIKRKSAVPCLGGLPLIGAAFSKNTTHTEKRNIIIFVRPQIINTFDQYQKITANQQEIYKAQADSKAFEKGIQLVD